MSSALEAASYIYSRYQKENSQEIDEMKLHKLLYLVQRESFVMLDKPMFPEAFEAWRYGPVMVCIRELYKNKTFQVMDKLPDEMGEFQPVFDEVFKRYASWDSWELSDLTHSESSWQKARNGCSYDAPCRNELKTEDIRKDAEWIKLRRFYYEEVLPTLHENKQ